MGAPSNTTGTLTDVVKTVFDQAVLFAYRANNVFRAMAQLKRDLSALPMRGNPVQFTLLNALAVATSALSETADPSAVALGTTTKSITLVEYGNLTESSWKLRLTSFAGIDMMAVREITANMEESLDIIARDVASAGTNVVRPGGKAKANLLATDVATLDLISFMVQKLRGFNSPTPDGGPYFPVIGHPDVEYDLMKETGQSSWTAPHVYSDPENFYRGEVGQIKGARWISNSNAKLDADAGSGSTVDVYHTIAFAYQGIGEAVGASQQVVVAPPTDHLQRFQPVGWKALLGFGRIRENSLYRLESASSIGTNV